MASRRSLFILVPVAAFLLFGAAHYTVFDDEAFSTLRYTMPAPDMVRALWRGAEPDPPFYYVLQNAWVRVFGIEPVGLRGLSILLFLVGLVFVHEAGRTWYDAATGRRALFFAALHPAHLTLGFAARWYSAMFCAAALLAWLTAKWAKAPRRSRRLILGWALAAAAVCYVNYFGAVVVALVWLAAVLPAKPRARGVLALALAAAFYAPWAPAFFRQAASFPQFSLDGSAMAASAGRTVVALLAGSVAAPRAWWVWLPLGVWAVLLLVLVRMKLRSVWPLAVVVFGALVAGAGSRTLIDKYVMALSAFACLLAAAVLRPGEREPGAARERLVSRAAVAMLVAGWLGCGVNLVTERNWLSLRWLDPFERAIADARGADERVEANGWVATHPAARYYIALAYADRSRGKRATILDWRAAARSPDDEGAAGQAIATPRSMAARLEANRPRAVATLEGATLTDELDWQRLKGQLRAGYEKVFERAYLEDPDAAWKDRIDPVYRHPTHRVVVTLWRARRTGR